MRDDSKDFRFPRRLICHYTKRKKYFLKWYPEVFIFIYDNRFLSPERFKDLTIVFVKPVEVFPDSKPENLNSDVVNLNFELSWCLYQTVLPNCFLKVFFNTRESFNFDKNNEFKFSDEPEKAKTIIFPLIKTTLPKCSSDHMTTHFVSVWNQDDNQLKSW